MPLWDCVIRLEAILCSSSLPIRIDVSPAVPNPILKISEGSGMISDCFGIGKVCLACLLNSDKFRMFEQWLAGFGVLRLAFHCVLAVCRVCWTVSVALNGYTSAATISDASRVLPCGTRWATSICAAAGRRPARATTGPRTRASLGA